MLSEEELWCADLCSRKFPQSPGKDPAQVWCQSQIVPDLQWLWFEPGPGRWQSSFDSPFDFLTLWPLLVTLISLSLSFLTCQVWASMAVPGIKYGWQSLV